MLARLAADGVLVLHLVFVAFVVLGGLLVAYRSWIALVHLPAVVWVVLLEFRGWPCPLTPLEQWLRGMAGQAGYEGDFVEHYLMPLLYPPGLTPSMQWLLGGGVLAVNLVIYGVLLGRRVAAARRERGTV
ncbi:MAG: DUF2784 domain-containing protein [Gammaproteobacteria bacterium]|nr:DUF2784 domain-containing protein [Gammaproteobacteria bacterium]